MKIFHYTTIESLAMILSQKTFRFSRLDTVDDPDEYSYSKKYGYNPAEFIFVACWSTNPYESIPQWKIYGGNEKGVRISFEQDMFPLSYEEIEHGCILPFLFDKDFYNDKDYIISLPYNFKTRESEFFLKVNCVDNPKSEMEDAYIATQPKIGTDIGKIAICKCNDWHFLDEHRFRICVAPKKNYSDIVTPFNVAFRDNAPYKKLYVDLPIKQKVFDNIEITLGPKVGLDGEIIVKALMNKYLNREDCRNSVFKGLVR